MTGAGCKAAASGQTAGRDVMRSESHVPDEGGAAARERGASLVEFALIAPLLLALIFGIIEFGWAFAQINDLRHGAREAARLAAVEDDWDVPTIASEICSRMDIGPTPPVAITLGPVSGAGGRGSTAAVSVTQTYASLTGFFDGLIGAKTLTSDIDFRVEQPVSGTALWWQTPGTYDCETAVFTP